MNDYDTDTVLDDTKLLVRTAREQNSNPQCQIMALKAAAEQIEREVMAAVQAKVMFNLLNGRI